MHLDEYAKTQPRLKRPCQACELPPETRQELDAGLRKRNPPRRVIVAWLADEGHDHITIHMVNAHAENGHHVEP